MYMIKKAEGRSEEIKLQFSRVACVVDRAVLPYRLNSSTDGRARFPSPQARDGEDRRAAAHALRRRRRRRSATPGTSFIHSVSHSFVNFLL